MSDPTDAIAIDERIAAIRENLRDLVEQAAGYSGASDENRMADRIAEQEKKLATLLRDRQALLE